MINICVISGVVKKKVDGFIDADVYTLEAPRADADGEMMTVWCFFNGVKVKMKKGDNVTVIGNLDTYGARTALVNCEIDKCRFKLRKDTSDDEPADDGESEPEGMDINEVVSANMEAIRTEQKMSVAEMAEKIGLKDALYYRRLSRETNWGLDEIETASRNLGIPMYKLIGERPRRDSLLGNDD